MPRIFRSQNGYDESQGTVGLTVMARDFSVIMGRDSEGYYVASVPDLPGCHTQATPPDELRTRIRKAIEANLELYGDAAEALESVGVQRRSVAA